VAARSVATVDGWVSEVRTASGHVAGCHGAASFDINVDISRGG